MNFPTKWDSNIFEPYSSLTSYPISRKTREQILRKVHYGQTSRQTDKQAEGWEEQA